MQYNCSAGINCTLWRKRSKAQENSSAFHLYLEVASGFGRIWDQEVGCAASPCLVLMAFGWLLPEDWKGSNWVYILWARILLICSVSGSQCRDLRTGVLSHLLLPHWQILGSTDRSEPDQCRTQTYFVQACFHPEDKVMRVWVIFLLHKWSLNCDGRCERVGNKNDNIIY